MISLPLIPLGGRVKLRPTLDIDLTAATLDARFVFTRASTAGYFDSDGSYKIAAINEIRRITGQGILIEGSATNYLKWSRDFTATGDWQRTNVTANLNQTGIDGAANAACQLTATDDNATVLRPYTSGYSYWCFSIYLKRISGSGKVYISYDGGTTWTECVLTTSWQRFWVYRNGQQNPNCGIRIETSGDVIAVDGAMNEVIGTTKSSAPTSVIFTAGGYLSRSADVLTMDPAGWMDFTQGSILVKHIIQPMGQVYPILLTLSDGTASNYIMIGQSSYTNNLIYSAAVVGGSTKASSVTAGYVSAPGSEARHATSWRSGRFSHVHNGACHPNSVGVPASLPTVSQILWGCKGDGNYRGAFLVSRFTYWNRPLLEDDLRRLTA